MDNDDFLGGLFDQQLAVTKAATAEVQKLRRRVSDLEDEIRRAPATAWELQERVVALEALLEKFRGEVKHGN